MRSAETHDRAREPLVGRAPLIAAITTFLSDRDDQTLVEIRQALAEAIEGAGADALAALGRALTTAGADWDYYPADPLARHIHHMLADRLLGDGSALEGAENLAAVAGRPVIFLANHLSYSDANVLEVLLFRGAPAYSDRLTVVAGPKVYSSLKRRFSSLCFGTIKTPQSSAVSSEEAVMNAREVARAARRCIDIAHDRLQKGDVLLVFAEGTRSRTFGLQPMLAAVTRYLECPGAWVVPVGIVGSEALFPIGSETLRTVRVTARLGRPFPAKALEEGAGGDRRLMMDAAGLAIAAVLPPAYRGMYADDAPDLDEARRLFAAVSA